MRTEVPEKVLRIVDDIKRDRDVPQTRLTVLKSWFKHPGRLAAFGLWIARKAAGRKGKTKGPAGELLNEARRLLGTSSSRKNLFDRIDRKAGEALRDRARAFQNRHERQRWGAVRIIECWPLLLVEEGLALLVEPHRTPSDGYKLAADWAQNYDPSVGTGLNGPSKGKLLELVRFMFCVEALEDR